MKPCWSLSLDTTRRQRQTKLSCLHPVATACLLDAGASTQHLLEETVSDPFRISFNIQLRRNEPLWMRHYFRIKCPPSVRSIVGPCWAARCEKLIPDDVWHDPWWRNFHRWSLAKTLLVTFLDTKRQTKLSCLHPVATACLLDAEPCRVFVQRN